MRGANVERVLKELDKGHLIILVDQYNHGKLISLVNHVTADDINFMITNARGLVTVGIEAERAKELDLTLQQTANSDEYYQAYAISIDVEGTTTGISSYERFDTIKALIDHDKKPEDFKRPGHIFPIIAHVNGIFGKQSHTEAGIELAKMNNSHPTIVMCDILNKEGEVAGIEDLKAFSKLFQLKLLTIDELLQYCLYHNSVVEKKDHSRLQNRVGEFDLISFTNLIDQETDLVLFYKNIHSAKESPVYIHKQCHCPLGLCDCHLALERTILRIKEMGGLCICLEDRKNKSLLNGADDESNTFFVLKILENLGVARFRIMNDFYINRKMLHDYGIHLIENSVPEYKKERKKVV